MDPDSMGAYARDDVPIEGDEPELTGSALREIRTTLPEGIYRVRVRHVDTRISKHSGSEFKRITLQWCPLEGETDRFLYDYCHSSERAAWKSELYGSSYDVLGGIEGHWFMVKVYHETYQGEPRMKVMPLARIIGGQI